MATSQQSRCVSAGDEYALFTINCRLQALSLHIILRDFRRVYKQRDLYPLGLKTEIEKELYNKL